MKLRFLLPLAGLIGVLPACGDDGDSATQTATIPNDTTTNGQLPTTSGDDTTGVVDPSTTTTGQGDDTTTTGEPETSTTSDDTTGDPVGCNAPADDADEDADGVANSADNCRCDANPNQLDFDGNAVGNVCDAPLTFTIADGVPPEFNKLATTATAAMGLSCEFPVDLIVVNGDVQVSLDDEGTAKIWSAQLNFADTPELECDLFILNVKLRIEKFFAAGPDAFVVGFPFALPDHDAGTISGQTDSPHAILVSGIINITESSNESLAPKGENPIEMVPGAFPVGTASVVNKGEQVSLAFDDSNSIIFMQTTMGGIEIKLTGLKGTMRMKK